jgi:hypothetical protein
MRLLSRALVLSRGVDNVNDPVRKRIRMCIKYVVPRRSYSNGQCDPNRVVRKIKKTVDFMNMGTLRKYHLPYRTIEFLLSVWNLCNL